MTLLRRLVSPLGCSICFVLRLAPSPEAQVAFQNVFGAFDGRMKPEPGIELLVSWVTSYSRAFDSRPHYRSELLITVIARWTGVDAGADRALLHSMMVAPTLSTALTSDMGYSTSSAQEAQAHLIWLHDCARPGRPTFGLKRSIEQASSRTAHLSFGPSSQQTAGHGDFRQLSGTAEDANAP